MNNLSLKTRIALAVSFLFVIFVAAMSYFTLMYFEREFKKTLSGQQFLLISSLADNIDDKLKLAHGTLIGAAAKIPPDVLNDADRVQHFLDSKAGLLSIFDNGLFLLSKEGELIAESPYLPNRRGRDISFREFFKMTVSTGEPHISTPYLSTHNPGHPAIMLTVPIFDKHGKLAAILGGSFDLMGENFLENLSHAQIGQSGYLYLYGRDRTLIIHPDKSRIMKQASPYGTNKLFDRALTGFEGSGETVNSRGVDMLASYKHLKATDWILAANYPLAEAYAPLYKAKRYFVVVTITGMVVVLLTVWFLMRRLTAPLLAITKHVEELTAKTDEHKLISIDSHDEIGTLAHVFNNMVMELDREHRDLQERELNFKALADNANIGILIASDTGTHLYANRQASEISGYNINELLESGIDKLAHADELQRISGRFNGELVQERIRGPWETAIIRKNGMSVPIEFTAAMTVWRGNPANLITFRDITERKQAEDALRESEVRYRRLLESVTDYIYSVQVENGRPVASSHGHACIALTGYTSEEYAADPDLWFRMVHEDDHQAVIDQATTVLSGKGVPSLEHRIIRKDGQVRWIRNKPVPHYDHQGGLIAYDGLVSDITERKQAEIEVQKLNAELEQRVRERTAELEASNRELETFCYSVSHDLRTPLRSIDGFSKILLEEYSGKMDDAGKEYQKRICSAALRMGDLIDALLNLSRVTRTELRRDTIDLSALVSEITNELQLHEPTRQAEFVIAENAHAKGDPRLLRTVLENLLGNAWKFSSKRPCAKIEFGVCNADSESSYYYVRDNGAGFDMRYINKLFGTFQRLHGVSEFEGTGIGLATVQRIIQRHGGRIWAESELGKGAVFYFTFE